MAALDDLLTIQNHDSAADRLRHRKGALPERAEVAAYMARKRSRERESWE